MPPKKRETLGSKLAAQKKQAKKDEKTSKKETKGKTKTRISKEEEQQQLYIMAGGAGCFVLFMIVTVVMASFQDPNEKEDVNATSTANDASNDYDTNTVMIAFMVAVVSIFSVPMVIDGFKRAKKTLEERQAAQAEKQKLADLKVQKVKDREGAREAKIKSKQADIENQAKLKEAAQKDAEVMNRLKEQGRKLAEERARTRELIVQEELMAQQNQWDEWEASRAVAQREKAKIREANYQAAMKRWHAEQKQAQLEAKSKADKEQAKLLWDMEQQLDLDRSINDHPADKYTSTHERWEAIAAAVSGKDMRQCVARYTELRDYVLKKERDEQKAYWACVSDMGGDVPEGVMDKYDELDEDILSESDDEESSSSPIQANLNVELQPEKRGTVVGLTDYQMGGLATLQVETLSALFSCCRCSTTTEVALSGRDANEADKKIWCDKCSTLMSIMLRPTLVTEESAALCYLGTPVSHPSRTRLVAPAATSSAHSLTLSPSCLPLVSLPVLLQISTNASL
jgi:hypothetical protein